MKTHLWIETTAMIFKDQLKAAMMTFMVSGRSTGLLFQVQTENNTANIGS